MSSAIAPLHQNSSDSDNNDDCSCISLILKTKVAKLEDGVILYKGNQFYYLSEWFENVMGYWDTSDEVQHLVMYVYKGCIGSLSEYRTPRVGTRKLQFWYHSIKEKHNNDPLLLSELYVSVTNRTEQPTNTELQIEDIDEEDETVKTLRYRQVHLHV